VSSALIAKPAPLDMRFAIAQLALTVVPWALEVPDFNFKYPSLVQIEKLPQQAGLTHL